MRIAKWNPFLAAFSLNAFRMPWGQRHLHLSLLCQIQSLEIRDILLGDGFDFNRLGFIDFLAFDRLDCRLYCLLAELLRLLRNGTGQGAGRDGLQTVISSIKTDNLHVRTGLGAKSLNRA